MYIHGGRDLKEGSISSLWRLNLTACREMGDDPSSTAWESIQTSGKGPGAISHHKSCLIDPSTVVIYGGLSGEENSNVIFKLDLDRHVWSHMDFKQAAEVLPRDDHALAVKEDGTFLVFGGFVAGSRCNETLEFSCQSGAAEAKVASCEGGDKSEPQIRASMSAVCADEKLWVFGGQDDDNNKLADLWCYDCAKCAWSQVSCKEGEYWPCARSGHSAVVWNGKMYIFGGIFELTKELNDLCCLDLATCKFSGNDEQLNSSAEGKGAQ